MTIEFKSFSKILHISKLYMSITQKIHGSNAQIYIYKDADGKLDLICGSRSRWIYPGDDNYGFAGFVDQNKEEFIAKLGEGRHFGEWAGTGINNGEGLKEKTLVLFNQRRWQGKELPPRTTIVPELYRGKLSIDAINESMDRLREHGSFLVPGFMKPEGIVIEIDGNFYKNVFDLEEVAWKQTTKTVKEFKPMMDVSYLLQPIRLEKLLSRDERYIREYPESLGSICSAYVEDLKAEGQFRSENEDDLKAELKSLGKQVFFFVKSIVLASGRVA